MRIAHDFNNSLTSMLGNAELVQEALEVINCQENNNPETAAGHAIPINRDVIRNAWRWQALSASAGLCPATASLKPENRFERHS